MNQEGQQLTSRFGDSPQHTLFPENTVTEPLFGKDELAEVNAPLTPPELISIADKQSKVLVRSLVTFVFATIVVLAVHMNPTQIVNTASQVVPPFFFSFLALLWSGSLVVEEDLPPEELGFTYGVIAGMCILAILIQLSVIFLL